MDMPAQYAVVCGGVTAHGEDEFQRLLLQFAGAATSSSGRRHKSLLSLFCRATREFFDVDAVLYCEVVSPNELVVTESDGWMADSFCGRRLTSRQGAMAFEALQQRTTIYVNGPSPYFSLAREFQARSIMAVPVVVGNVPVGVAIFFHNSDPDFFSDDRAAKATILAGQIGSLLEADRLTIEAREDHRRAEMLAEVAHVLHTVPDADGVTYALADRLRILLRAGLVCVLLEDGDGYRVASVASEDPRLAGAFCSFEGGKEAQFAAGIASRAIAAGGTITLSVGPATHPLGDLVPAGTLIAAPLLSASPRGAVLVYPRRDSLFTAEEQSLVSAVAGFGGMAMANANLLAISKVHTSELHQLLEIAAELGSIGQLDRFMQRFVIRAAEFLGFERAFVGLLENGVFQVRWLSEGGQAARASQALPDGTMTRALLSGEVAWADDATQDKGLNFEAIAGHPVKQLLAVPLHETSGEVLGMFGVLDRATGAHISQEDVRRAQVLAGQVAVALQATRSLHLSEQFRGRADALMALALELSSLLRLPEFAKEFFRRATEMAGASGGALITKHDVEFETDALRTCGKGATSERSIQRRLAIAASRAVIQYPQTVISANASELLGADIAQLLGWEDCTLVRLQTPSRELAGVLCLANRRGGLRRRDDQFLQAIAAHASVALENVRLFSRMERANRHWVEIFDAISDFIVVHDHADNVLRVNRSLAEHIGASPQQLIGTKVGAMLPVGKDRPLPSCPFCLHSERVNDEFVDPMLEHTYLVSTSRVHAASSEGMQTIHVLKDITDRREAEKRYRELFDNVQEGLFFSTPEGRFVEVNDALVRMLGYEDRDSLLKEDLPTRIFSSIGRHGELVEGLERNGVVRNHEEALRRKDGSTVHVLINAFSVRDRHQRTVQLRGVMLDISGLKNYQSQLQRERDFSGNVLNNTQSMILVVDTSGMITYANRRWADMGHEQAKLLGTPMEQLVAPGRRQVFTAAFQAILGGQQSDNLDLQILRGDGRLGHFSVNLGPMRDEQGHIASLVVVMTDVTDAAALQAKLLHAEKMAAVGQLVSGVAHEVNNPLTAILGFTDLLMEDPGLPENARRDLRVVLQEAQRTKQIVQNLLSFARQMPPQRKPVQLNAILRRTVQLRAYDLNNHGVEVVEKLGQDLPQVVGDAHQLQQVFLNILNNAYDAVHETGRPARIEIATAQTDEFVEISFCDNGPGISNPERIFDPFFTTKDVGKGTGLGLSICYGIVREHGGEILCHNNADGMGATFTVRVPRSGVLETAPLNMLTETQAP